MLRPPSGNDDDVTMVTVVACLDYDRKNIIATTTTEYVRRTGKTTLKNVIYYLGVRVHKQTTKKGKMFVFALQRCALPG